MREFRHLLILGLAFLVLATTAIAADVEEPARLWFDPPVLDLLPGERATVAVRVDGIPAAGLAAFQLELRFDPRKIEVLDPNSGYSVPAHAPLGTSPLCAMIRRTLDCNDPEWMLSSTGRQPVGTSSIDPENGKVTVAYGTAGQSAPPSGDGALAMIEVVAKRKVTTSVEVVDAILAGATDPPQRYPYVFRSQSPRPVKPGIGRGR